MTEAFPSIALSIFSYPYHRVIRGCEETSPECMARGSKKISCDIVAGSKPVFRYEKIETH